MRLVQLNRGVDGCKEEENQTCTLNTDTARFMSSDISASAFAAVRA
jgi:hypothetical protein